MIPVKLTVTDEVEPALAALAKRFPREYPKALRDFGLKLIKRTKAGLRHGEIGGTLLPPLHPITIRLRRMAKWYQAVSAGRRKKFSSAKMKKAQSLEFLPRAAPGGPGSHGGVLPESLASYSSNNTLFVGWTNASLQAVVERWLEAKTRQTYKRERRMFRIVMGRRARLPRTYKKPERLIFERYVSDPQFQNDAVESVSKTIKALLLNKQRRVVHG